MTTWDGRIRADARHLPIADESVQCVVTSPPYWGLRDYADQLQIGLEVTPELYVESIVGVFREVWRVLEKDGTLWLNIGDCYATGAGKVGNCPGGGEQGDSWTGPTTQPNRLPIAGLKPKDLVGIPWRVAFALQADGWYLRSDIIWAKKNCMPESVTDRPTRSHEYIFLLTKSERYFYDAAAIAEPGVSVSNRGGNRNMETATGVVLGRAENPHCGLGTNWEPSTTRNKRTVWNLGTKPYPEAHYATFPPDLVEPCILAGSRPGDIVLDPFFGSGTVGMVAERLNRRWIGSDLGYQHLQAKRLRNVQKELLGCRIVDFSGTAK